LPADCPRREAARLYDPCGIHSPMLVDLFLSKGGT
jgi:hypothetical protein